MAETSRQPGGFLPPTSSQYARALPSPAPSTASSRAAARLPAPRSKPLVPGSRKEDYARDYVSQRLLHIARRYVKKHGGEEEEEEQEGGNGEDEKENGNRDQSSGEHSKKNGAGDKTKEERVTGYENADQLCADLEEVVDVLWFSGTLSLQIPYLINVAHALTTYLASFPPAPRSTFTLLHKLDHCFASLLIGRDVKTRAPLSGFVASSSSAPSPSAGPSAATAQLHGFSRTDMVRIKSIADETRRLVAVVMSGEADVENREGYDEREDNEDDDADNSDFRDSKPRVATRMAAAAGSGEAADVSRLVKKEYHMLDPFEEQIDPGEGIVYKLKPEGGNYGGFVADEETDEEEEQGGGSVPTKIKKEDENEEDGDDDGDEFIDVAQPTIIPKRKVDDDADLSDGDAEAGDPKKRTRIKEEERGNRQAEDKDTVMPDRPPALLAPSSSASDGDGDGDGDDDDDDDDDGDGEGENDNDNDNDNDNASRAPPRPSAYLSNPTATPSQPGPAGAGAPPGSGARQFHFTLDDSDDDSEDGEALPNAGTNTANGLTHHHQHQQRSLDDDRDGEGEEEDEEDEEMHMNVARVYEKTLVRLDKIMLEEEFKDARAERGSGHDV